MNGFITGSLANWPSWVLFQCSTSVLTLVTETNPRVVLGRRVSLGP